MARPTLEEAKRLYIERYTMEHIPEWAQRPDSSGEYYAPAYKSDLEWYENSSYPGEGKHGEDAKRYCISRNQTWPLGNRLNAKQAQALITHFTRIHS